MKYVQIFNGLEVDAEDGALNWPWVAADAQHVGDRVKRARQAARDHVDAELAAAKAKPKPKAAGDA